MTACSHESHEMLVVFFCQPAQTKTRKSGEMVTFDLQNRLIFVPLDGLMLLCCRKVFQGSRMGSILFVP